MQIGNLFIFLSYSIDIGFFNGSIEISHIYANDRFNYYCFNIFYAVSRLILSLCLISLTMLFISIFGYRYYLKKSNELRINKWKSLKCGSYLRLVNALEYFYIFLFTGNLFNKDFISIFFNSYNFPSIVIILIEVFSLLLLIPSILLKVMMPFFNVEIIENSGNTNENLSIANKQKKC